jgi:hypothetical protein
MDRNWKEAGLAYFKIPSRHLPGGAKEKGKQLQSGESVSRLEFEVVTSGYRTRSISDPLMVQAENHQSLITKIQIAS